MTWRRHPLAQHHTAVCIRRGDILPWFSMDASFAAPCVVGSSGKSRILHRSVTCAVFSNTVIVVARQYLDLDGTELHVQAMMDRHYQSRCWSCPDPPRQGPSPHLAAERCCIHACACRKCRFQTPEAQHKLQATDAPSQEALSPPPSPSPQNALFNSVAQQCWGWTHARTQPQHPVGCLLQRGPGSLTHW